MRKSGPDLKIDYERNKEIVEEKVKEQEIWRRRRRRKGEREGEGK